eukprot:142450_1
MSSKKPILLQYDKIDDNIDEIQHKINILQYKQYDKHLMKFFVNSLFIQGYVCDINTQTNIYETICLFYGIHSLLNAVSITDTEICKYICKHYIDIDNDITTALIKATNIGDTDIINILLPYYLDSFDFEQIKSVSLITYNSFQNNNKISNPLISICIDKLMDNIQVDKYMKITKLLLKSNFSPNTLSEQHNASLLHYACLRNDFKFIKLLIDEYNISLQLAIKYDNHNNTAIDYLNASNNVNSMAIKTYLTKEIEIYQRRKEKQREYQQQTHNNNGGIAVFIMISFCCILPWSILSIINNFIFMSTYQQFNISFICIAIISMVITFILLIFLVIMSMSSIARNNKLIIILLLITIIMEQVLSIVLLILQLAFNNFTPTT